MRLFAADCRPPNVPAAGVSAPDGRARGDACLASAFAPSCLRIRPRWRRARQSEAPLESSSSTLRSGLTHRRDHFYPTGKPANSLAKPRPALHPASEASRIPPTGIPESRKGPGRTTTTNVAPRPHWPSRFEALGARVRCLCISSHGAGHRRSICLRQNVFSDNGSARSRAKPRPLTKLPAIVLHSPPGAPGHPAVRLKIPKTEAKAPRIRPVVGFRMVSLRRRATKATMPEADAHKGSRTPHRDCCCPAFVPFHRRRH